MAEVVRPRRSVLYMPAANTRALEKARGLPADVLILDLEDAVAPDAKETARAQAVAAVRQGGYAPREVIVRVNGLDTDWGAADLKAMGEAGPDAVLLPKIESADQVRTAANLLPEELPLWCMIETPRGVLRANVIAGASHRLRCLVMGTSDLASDLHARPGLSREALLTSLSLCVLAARANGLAVLDGVHLDLEDEDGFVDACIQGRDLGFDGKTLIHPRQLAAANRIFAPDDEEVEEAQVIVDAFARAEAAGQGVVVVNGRLVENLHVAQAQRLLDLADAIGQREQETGSTS